MEHDQDRFYDEDFDPREDNIPEEEEQSSSSNVFDDVNDMKFFIELLKHIRVALEDGKSVPLSRKKMVDTDRILDMLDDLEKNLPDAVQYGLQMYSERDRIMREAETTAMTRISSAEMRVNAALEHAKADAEQMVLDAENEKRAILEDARDQADRMVEESEILRRAREEARILKNDARVEASELRLKAQHEAYQMLATAEEQLSEACKSIRRRRSELGDADQ